MILVTGATGTIGKTLVGLLAAAGEPARAMTRDPARATFPAGVEAVYGDFTDADSLLSAVKGVDTVFLLSAALSDHDRALLSAAGSAGVRRVVKLSAIGTDDPDLPTADLHRPGEEAVLAGDWNWTLLRPSSFASNTLGWAAGIRAGEPVQNLTGDGRMGIVDPRDVAAVAAAVLTTDSHAGQAYTLTGPDELSVPDQAGILAEVLGRPVQTAEVSDDAAWAGLLAAGFDAARADSVLAGFAYVRAGRAAIVTPDVARVLGRPATSFRRWVEDHREMF
jgi:uncharacterized protein YbjT (DUF2867 family)